MFLKDLPIRKKLMTVILMISAAVLLLTCSAYFAYEFITFRQTTIRQLSMLGKIIAANSTAALASGNEEEVTKILSAVKADRHIIAAGLYDANGKLFSYYPISVSTEVFPDMPEIDGYRFYRGYVIGYESVMQEKKLVGTLFLKSDTRAVYDRLLLYSFIAILVITVSLLLAYLLSGSLEAEISAPILALAVTARFVSERHDYSVRATKLSDDEIGELTDAFNHMLGRIEKQNEEITAFNQKLEQMVTNRTLELQAVNKELEAFSYSVSHDLRAPLRSIHGYMNIFSEEYYGKVDDEARRLIDIVLKNGLKMGQLIDDLLAFSHLGRRDLVKGTVSMKEMATNVWEELRRLEQGRDITCTIQDLPQAYADGVTMRQVWANLISNAIKYSKNKAEAIIEIGFRYEGDQVVYFVKDNGAGFNMKYYPKLFGVFSRLHSLKEFEGTGVGLAIAHRIIEKHGGKIWAEAEINEGATFYFSLPKS